MNVVFYLNVGLGSILNVIRYLERQVSPKQLYILIYWECVPFLNKNSAINIISFVYYNFDILDEFVLLIIFCVSIYCKTSVQNHEIPWIF